MRRTRMDASFFSKRCMLWLSVLFVGLMPVVGLARVVEQKTVSLPNTILNEYAVLADNAYAGTATLYLRAPSSTTLPMAAPQVSALEPGDLLLVVQMQGAKINHAADNATYGEVVSYGSAGLYEFIRVKSFDPQTGMVSLNTDCGGLKNNYLSSEHAQVLRVPEYTNLTIDVNGSVVAPAWNGELGGIVAIRAKSLLLQGKVDVSAKGFRGGRLHQGGLSAQQDMLMYRSTNPQSGAEKGEGVAGFYVEYDVLGGRYGRGAAANGGGGGNGFNASGGGGANGNNGRLWTGFGVMDDGGGMYVDAWKKDPRYQKEGILSRSSGGGAGGYSQSLANMDAAQQGPGHPDWGGNRRQDVGGQGGRPTANGPARLFFGGGGGAGDADGQAGGRGGQGGGMVLLLLETLDGSGEILANGEAGEGAKNPSAQDENDGSGGGGAGGSVLIRARQVSGVVIHAKGGMGGSQVVLAGPHQNEAEGPGGGGGGGYVVLPFDSNIAVYVNGALAGTTTSSSLTEFPLNGATGGGAGLVDRVPDFLPTNPALCLSADLFVSISPSGQDIFENEGFSYAITVTNNGPDEATGVPFVAGFSPSKDTLPWNCTPVALCKNIQGRGTIRTSLDLKPQESVVFFVTLVPPFEVPLDRTLRYTASLQATFGIQDPNYQNNDVQLETRILSGMTPQPSGAEGTPVVRQERILGGGLSCQMSETHTGGHSFLWVVVWGAFVAAWFIRFKMTSETGCYGEKQKN